MKNLLYNKVLGCLAGGLVGDAMGAPVEAWHYKALRRKYGKITTLLPDLGIHQLRTRKGPYTTTDDMYLIRLVCRTFIRKGGRITAYDLAETWNNELNLHITFALHNRIYAKLCQGVPPREVGYQISSNSTKIGYQPVGIINACDPRGAAIDMFELGSLSALSYSQESTMALVAAIAEAFKPNTTINAIIEASKRYSSPKVAEYIDRAIAVAQKFDDVFEAIPVFYEELLEKDDDKGLQTIRMVTRGELRMTEQDYSLGFSPLETLPIALAFFYVSKGDPMKAIIGGVNFGRASDTIACFAGSIAGAWKGIDAIDQNLTKKIDEADKLYYHNEMTISEYADEMRTPILNTMKEKEASVTYLHRIAR